MDIHSNGTQWLEVEVKKEEEHDESPPESSEKKQPPSAPLLQQQRVPEEQNHPTALPAKRLGTLRSVLPSEGHCWRPAPFLQRTKRTMVSAPQRYEYRDVRSTYLSPAGDTINMYGIVTEWTMPR